jgi:U6 snRNA-associated Sm-like protein LSm2
LVDHEVTVELKNDIQIRGTLKSVDQYLNIKLDDIQVVEELKYPHLVSQSFGGVEPQKPLVSWLEAHADCFCSQSSVKNVFIRGSVVRYVHLPGSAVDTALLEDGLLTQFLFSTPTANFFAIATRREAANQASKAK